MPTNDTDALMASATHDIANALVAVLGWASLARRGEVPAEEALAAIEAAANAAHRTALDALGDPRESSATELRALASDLVRLLGPQARDRAVRLEVVGGESWVACPRTDVLRVAWNLVLNAIQVLPRGGAVTLTVGPGVLIVSDDGPGMDRATLRRALEGGTTTRRDGHGLGLASVQRLVTSHGGALSVDTSPESGARFRITLPVATVPSATVPSATVPSATVPSATVPSATGEADAPRTSQVRTRQELDRVLAREHPSVLVVDDDDGVRDLLSTTLRLRGLRVHAARAAADLECLEERFDIALVDLTLGDASGLDVVASLRERALSTVIVAMSGLPQLPEVAPERAPDRWLRKPFDATQLFDALGIALEPGSATGF